MKAACSGPWASAVPGPGPWIPVVSAAMPRYSRKNLLEHHQFNPAKDAEVCVGAGPLEQAPPGPGQDQFIAIPPPLGHLGFACGDPVTHLNKSKLSLPAHGRHLAAQGKPDLSDPAFSQPQNFEQHTQRDRRKAVSQKTQVSPC